jgi:hypothetical protein
MDVEQRFCSQRWMNENKQKKAATTFSIAVTLRKCSHGQNVQSRDMSTCSMVRIIFRTQDPYPGNVAAPHTLNLKRVPVPPVLPNLPRVL